MTKLLAKAQILILIGSVLALSQGAMADRERGVYIGGGLEIGRAHV